MNEFAKSVYDYFNPKPVYKEITHVKDDDDTMSSSGSSYSMPEFPDIYEAELCMSKSTYESILEQLDTLCVSCEDPEFLYSSPFMFQYITGDAYFLKQIERIIKKMTHVFREYKVVYVPHSHLEEWLLWSSILQGTMSREEEIRITHILFEKPNFLYKMYSTEAWLRQTKSTKYIIRIRDSVATA